MNGYYEVQWHLNFTHSLAGELQSRGGLFVFFAISSETDALNPSKIIFGKQLRDLAPHGGFGQRFKWQPKATSKYKIKHKNGVSQGTPRILHLREAIRMHIWPCNFLPQQVWLHLAHFERGSLVLDRTQAKNLDSGVRSSSCLALTCYHVTKRHQCFATHGFSGNKSAEKLNN